VLRTQRLEEEMGGPSGVGKELEEGPEEQPEEVAGKIPEENLEKDLEGTLE